MPAFFLALIAAAVATVAGREAVQVARLARALGSGTGLLAAVWTAAIVSSGLAGWLASTLVPIMSGPAKSMLVAFALVAGAVELVILRPKRAPAEPTRSIAAILIVLLAAQVTDAARLLVLALAAASAAPSLAALGGAIGSGAALTAAWTMAGEWERSVPAAALRWAAAGSLMVAGIITGLSARGLIG